MKWLTGHEKDCCGRVPIKQAPHECNQDSIAKSEVAWKHFLAWFREVIEKKYPNDHSLRQIESELGGALFDAHVWLGRIAALEAENKALRGALKGVSERPGCWCPGISRRAKGTHEPYCVKAKAALAREEE